MFYLPKHEYNQCGRTVLFGRCCEEHEYRNVHSKPLIFPSLKPQKLKNAQTWKQNCQLCPGIVRAGHSKYMTGDHKDKNCIQIRRISIFFLRANHHGSHCTDVWAWFGDLHSNYWRQNQREAVCGRRIKEKGFPSAVRQETKTNEEPKEKLGIWRKGEMSDTDSEGSENKPEAEVHKGKKGKMARVGNKHAKKNCRKTELGWLHAGKQVRKVNGGGTRNLSVP